MPDDFDPGFDFGDPIPAHADDDPDAPTVRDAAGLLARLFDEALARGDGLRLGVAAAALREAFGTRFVSAPGRVAPDVREAFQRRVGPNVVFDGKDSCWRAVGKWEVKDGPRMAGW